MTRKENLLFEIDNLNRVLEKYRSILEKGHLDDVAYLQLNDVLGSVMLALRYYFGEEAYTEHQIIILQREQIFCKNGEKYREKQRKVKNGCNVDKMGFCLDFVRFRYMILHNIIIHSENIMLFLYNFYLISLQIILQPIEY